MLDRDELIRVAPEEMQKHSFDTFVDNPPSVAQGGRGHVVTGCPVCKKKFQSLNQFTEHLISVVMPVIADRTLDGREPGED
jgi:hypothetical protein